MREQEEVLDCIVTSSTALILLFSLVVAVLFRERSHCDHQRNEKISNSSSFGIIDIAEQSSTSDRIIVIVKMACFIHDGAYR